MTHLHHVDYFVVHAAATTPSMNIGVAEIREWHLARGWDDVGYHLVIRRSGVVEYGRNFSTRGAHTRGYNSKSLGICLVGGLDSEGLAENNFTEEQFDTLEQVLKGLHVLFPLATVKGHRDFPDVTKECPCFDVEAWRKGRNIW